MLVAAHRVEAAIGGVLHLVHEVVVHQVRALRVEQRRMDVDPHRRMLLPEIVRQLGVRHQVEPQQLHGCPFLAETTREYDGGTPWFVNSPRQAQCPSSHVQPWSGCCIQWPGTQVVWPSGGATYWPGRQTQLVPLASQWPGCQTTGPALTGGRRNQLALWRRRRSRDDHRGRPPRLDNQLSRARRR